MVKFLLLIFFVGACSLKGEDLGRLSDAEADAIVFQEMEAVKMRKLEHLKVMAKNVPVEQRSTTKSGTVFNFEKVIRPDSANSELTVRPEPAPAGLNLSDELRAQILTRQEKSDVLLTLSTAVFEGPVTEIRWANKAGQLVAYSSIDFSLFGAMPRIETDTKYFSFLMFTREGQRERHSVSIPTKDEILKLGVPFFVETDSPDDNDSRDQLFLEVLNELHRYYTENEAQLRIVDQRRKALTAARERYLKANPPVKEDVVIQFSKMFED